MFTKDGSFAEYIVTDAIYCFPLANDVSFEQGATSIGNPLSAVVMLEDIKALKPRGVVQTAAFSQFGKMMIRLFRENNIPVVNIVRKDEHVAILKEEYK